MRIGATIAAACAMLAGGVAAQPAPAGPAPTDLAGSFALIIENDNVAGRDRYYTNGFLLSWRSPAYNPPAWLGAVSDRAAFLLPPGGTLRWGLSFGQNLFTPEDVATRTPDPLDRPYAAFLYGAVTVLAYTPTELASLELQLGVVGPAALGEQVQGVVHDIRDFERSRGWDTQLKDELGVNLVGTRQWRLNRPTGLDGISVGLVPSVAASLGNVQTYAGAGALLRIGSELEADFGPPRVRPVSAGSVFFEPRDGFGWYAFAGVEGRAVLRDISLDGNTWRDSRSVDREPFVGDASLGAAVMIARARLTATYTVRSREFDGQRDASQFGSLSLAFRF